jgi:membrane protein implicated in regulation of membrane protease activity
MMDHISESARTRPTTAAMDAAPLALAGVVAVATLATYLARPARRSRAADEQRQSLVAYLRDHLGGADAAVHVVRRLAATHEGTTDGRLFRQLAEEFEQDRATVRALLAQLGASARSPKRVAARASAALLGFTAGGTPGQLSLLRTLEALAIGIQGKRCMWQWIRDRGLTLLLMAMFLVFLVGQVLSGRAEYNAEQQLHGQSTVSMRGYLATGHPWEALFENWESEFLQMAVFVLLTTFLIQRGSPESRRPGVKELVDTDPRDFADDPDAPWPVRRGGWILRLYEHSLGLAFILLFLISWLGHALGGFAEYAEDQVAHQQPPPGLTDYLTSARFWFESFQNWQSEFLAIASMVWLAVYLRQRWSPESKPVHAPHEETGR